MRLFEVTEGRSGSRLLGLVACGSHGGRGKPAGVSGLALLLVALALAAVPAGRTPWAQTPAEDELWTLGNCNLDRRFDLADTIMMLDFLFGARHTVPCVPLCDVTGDSRFDIADPIAALSYIFDGKPLSATTPPREEQCDAIDNDCDGLHEEGCPAEGIVAVDLAWDPVTRDAQGSPEEPLIYRIYTGTRSGQYTDARNVRETTQFLIHGLTAGVRYYFAVTAIDRAGNESDYSNEVTAIAGPIF